MSEFKDLRPAAKAFIAAVVIGGVVVLGQSIHALYAEPIDPQWFVFAGLTLLTGSFTVKVPGINASLSVSETFVFASVLLFGAPAGAVTVLLECLIILFWMRPGRSIHKILFNTAAPAIAIWASGTVFFAISGIEPYVDQSAFVPLRNLLIPLLTFTLLYFLLNSWLVAIALGFETNRRALSIWSTNFTWLAVNYFSGASVAGLIVTYMRDDDISTLAIIVPLLLVSYLTFRTAMGRVEDSNRHLNQLNRLYLSTIETLAMAIDAKDQITHGHIRRVQSYAVGLAKHVGIADERSIKAIEAAALLHDMGKLAVPEYILNKPGRLTDAEFDKMKLHASVGADILSAIDFPYPVVPIVRHHHENWDGTGYPAGLKGTDIPIGARILSVVDCFDALTSDRPYRPRLSDNDALKILLERRGKMYDPLVVDTFISVHNELASQIAPPKLPRHVLNEITGSTQSTLVPPDSPRLDAISASSDEMLTLYDLAHAVTAKSGIGESGDVIVNHIRRLIPFTQAVLFWYDHANDELEARHVTGSAGPLIKGLRIQLGQRLSGWVAANRQTIANSDPTLDLGEIARTTVPRLRSCLSTSLVCDGQLVGVLSLYADLPDAFSDDHRRVIEVIARQIAHTFKRAADLDTGDRLDSVTGLPRFESTALIPQRSDNSDALGSDRTLIFVDVVGLKSINSRYGRQVGDEVLRHVARNARAALRLADFLSRHGSDEFVAILDNTNISTATEIAQRLRRNVTDAGLSLNSGSLVINVDIEFTCVAAPADGHSFPELLAVAQSRLNAQRQASSQVH
jgi:diguanylate cyclase (GGDEF)-like protein/putative nucleotidyltransferase with HDIG domain